MNFIAQSRREAPVEALRSLSKYLLLSSDSTGRARQDDVLTSCFFAAIDEIERRVDMVLLARSFKGEGQVQLPLILPFDERSPVKIESATQGETPIDGIEVETRQGRYHLQSQDPITGKISLSLQYGYESWQSIDAGLQFAVMKLAASSYDHRLDDGRFPIDVERILQGYHSFQIGRGL